MAPVLRVAARALAGVVALAPAASAQLTLRVAVPPGTPAGEVSVAGTFNAWTPGLDAYRLVSHADGWLSLTLPDSVRGAVAFKFTRGSWERVETAADGGDVPDRTAWVPATGAVVSEGTVAAWRESAAARPSTASLSVRVWQTAFRLPRLGRTRTVRVYLPPDYATGGRRYPVLYLHDGQNVFDDATSYAGEWGVDETLDRLHATGDRGVIVVAVDHGGARRMDEYGPWRHPEHGGGEADRYLADLVHAVKPAVDRAFRTRRGRLDTGVAGSSMGGLVSLYAILRYPGVFGRAGVFSPSLWIAPRMDALAAASPPRPGARIALVSGAQEVGTTGQTRYGADQTRVALALERAGWRMGVDLDTSVVAGGTHSEAFWRSQFARVYRFLFAPRTGRQAFRAT